MEAIKRLYEVRPRRRSNFRCSPIRSAVVWRH